MSLLHFSRCSFQDAIFSRTVVRLTADGAEAAPRDVRQTATPSLALEGPVRGELRVRLRGGTAGEVGGGLVAACATGGARIEVGAYPSLKGADVAPQAFALTSQASAFLFGHHEADYFRGRGAELPVQSRPASGP